MPHFRNFHGAAFDFAPVEPAEASNEKGLLVDFTIIGARLGADDTADSFVFIDEDGPGFHDDEFDAFIPAPADLPAPSPATTPVFEDDLIIGATAETMAEDQFLF